MIKMNKQAFHRYSYMFRKKHFLLFFLLYILTPGVISAQSDLILQDVILGKAEVSAPNSVTLKPGFQAREGSNFHAFIGANQVHFSSMT